MMWRMESNPTTETETVIDRYYGTLTEHHNHPQGIGPVIVEVVRCEDGVHRPWSSVRLNGRHAFGWCGMVDADGNPPTSAVTPSFVIRHDDPEVDEAELPVVATPGDPSRLTRPAGGELLTDADVVAYVVAEIAEDSRLVAVEDDYVGRFYTFRNDAGAPLVRSVAWADLADALVEREDGVEVLDVDYTVGHAGDENYDELPAEERLTEGPEWDALVDAVIVEAIIAEDDAAPVPFPEVDLDAEAAAMFATEAGR